MIASALSDWQEIRRQASGEAHSNRRLTAKLAAFERDRCARDRECSDTRAVAKRRQRYSIDSRSLHFPISMNDSQSNDRSRAEKTFTTHALDRSPITAGRTRNAVEHMDHIASSSRFRKPPTSDSRENQLRERREAATSRTRRANHPDSRWTKWRVDDGVVRSHSSDRAFVDRVGGFDADRPKESSASAAARSLRMRFVPSSSSSSR